MTKPLLDRARTRSKPRSRPAKTGRGIARSAKVNIAFTSEDFVALAFALRQPLVTHGVQPNVRASLLEDILFQFAVFIDERVGSEFHESISGMLSEHAKQLAATPEPVDSLVAEVEIAFIKGGKVELNVLRSSLEKRASLRLVLEIALGVRDVTEIRSRVDTKRRFRELMTKKAGIRALRFKSGNESRASWKEVCLRGSPYGDFEQSIDGLIACIEVVTRE